MEIQFNIRIGIERRDVLVELWLSLDVLSFKPAWRPGQQQNSLISGSNFIFGVHESWIELENERNA